MRVIFKNATVYKSGSLVKHDMLFDGASLSLFSGELFPMDAKVIENTVILPGFCDVHVHFREPGFSYKETIKSGCAAAAHGGYTAVMTMPNLSPVPDCHENLEKQLLKIREDAFINVYPYASITKGELGKEISELEGMSGRVLAFSDDGKGVQDESIMLSAMQRAKRLGKVIAAHCEDISLVNGGYIHDGEYARLNGHRGICSESEFLPIMRDIKLAKETGVKYHVCHVSAKESVEAIRAAKKEGVDITCETAPHYLVFNDMDIADEGRFKMNPPIRSEEDRLALIEGIKDGTIDMIATDHAPHSEAEKSKGLEGSLMGVVGLESAFAVLYTHLVKTGIISLNRLVELMAINPRERFLIDSDSGYTVFDVGEEYSINSDDFLSMGKATPFEGMNVFGRCLLTCLDGKCVYTDKRLSE